MYTKWIYRQLKQLLHDETGQALTEYFLVVVLTVIPLYGSFKLFNQILFQYYEDLAKWISMPIP